MSLPFDDQQKNIFNRSPDIDNGNGADAQSVCGKEDNDTPKMFQNYDMKILAKMNQFKALEESDEEYAGFRKQHTKSNILFKIEKAIISRLFKINHVILNSQAISVSLYHLILMFEYIQLLFFIFYKLDIENEYQPPKVEVITNTQGTGTYYFLYIVLSGIFCVFLIVIFGIANKLFTAIKTEDMKEGTKYIVTCLSLMMAIYLFLLQIPFTTILLQGYLCEEDPTEYYTLPSVQCDSVIHKIMIVFSTLSLILYAAFISIQQLMYTSQDFDSKIPWASFEKKLAILKNIYKLLLTIGFIFDKSDSYHVYITFSCFFICTFILGHRFQGAIIINKSVYFATVFYEILSIWLFISIGFQSITNTEIGMSDLFAIIICSLLSTCLYFALQERLRMQLLSNIKYPSKQLNTPSLFSNYVFHVYQLISRNRQEDRILIEDIFEAHLELCANEKCMCINIAGKLDGYYKYNEMKDRHFIEQQLMMSQSKFNYDTSMGLTHFNMPVENQIQAKQTFSQGLANNFSIRRRQSFKQIDLTATQEIEATNKIEITQNNISGQVAEEVNQLQNPANMEELILLFEDLETLDESSWTKKLNKAFYKLLSQIIQDGINKYPKNVELKIIQAMIHKNKLKNEFKAIFELMQCEYCQPSVFDQFQIFRKKLEIEKHLHKKQIQNNNKIGYLDVIKIYNYEKQVLKYQLHEYKTVHATTSFWRELLQKQIDATELRKRGNEISQNYQKIQESIAQAQKIHPDEIKLLFRYGIFLMNIINNEYDAMHLFEKCQIIFQSKLYKKGNVMPVNEETVFGENTNAAIVMISATATKLGTVIHCNDSLENILGYNRQSIVGQNIRKITPAPIAIGHDRLIQRYFDTARTTVVEKRRQIFAVSSEDYLRPVEILVKVYPHLSNQIMFVGFIQHAINFDIMDPPKQEYENQEMHYIMTNEKGYITNVTEGLKQDLGLHPKFFKFMDSMSTQLIKMDCICDEIFSPDLQDSLDSDGILVQLNTTSILEKVDLESLIAEEILEVKSSLGIYNAYIQHKKLVFDPNYSVVSIYRVIIISKVNETTQNSQRFTLLMSHFMSPDKDQQSNPQIGSFQNISDMQPGGIMSFGHQINTASVASSASNNNSANFERIVKEFKKTLGVQKTPKSVIYFNRALVLIILVTIALQSFDYQKMLQEVSYLNGENYHNQYSERRTTQLAQLAINARSYINIANDVELSQFEIASLARVHRRYDYIGVQLQKQGDDLQEVHEYMTQQRVTDDAGTDFIQSNYEYETVELFRFDNSNQVSRYRQPFRVSLFTYLNQILSINASKSLDIRVPDQLITNPPQECIINPPQNISLTPSQKSAYFIIANGLRDIRKRASDATIYQQNTANKNISNTPFLVLMIIGIIISLLTIALILYQIWIVERTQQEILSLYAHLQPSEIQAVLKKCSKYMNCLNDENLMSSFLQSSSLDPPSSSMNSTMSINNNNKSTTDKKYKQNLNGQFDQQSIVSEEDKEVIKFQKYIKKKNLQIRNINDGKAMKYGQGKDMYASMIKCSIQQVKEITDRDEEIAELGKMEAIKQERQKALEINDVEIANQKELNKPKRKLRNQLSSHFKRSKSKSNQVKKRVFGLKDDQFQIEVINNDDEESKEDNSQRSVVIEQEDIDLQKSLKKETFKVQENISEEMEERKSMFFKTIKTQSWGTKFVIIFLGIIFSCYFVQLMFYHTQYKEELSTLQKSIPIIFNRFRYLMLSYAFLRERIIHNNSLSSFDIEDPIYGHDIDMYYNDLSTKNEQTINNLKAYTPPILSTIMQIVSDTDSESFCSKIIQPTMLETYEVYPPLENVNQDTQVRAYSTMLTTIIAACTAAEKGDITTLKELKVKKIDLNMGDYDGVTPLHLAVRANQIDVARYLIVVVKIHSIKI